ncbi:MAG: S9 family peptidase [Burkholderiales bacterium]|nr:S9 family peptidase [Burkholderiales bacterium]
MPIRVFGRLLRVACLALATLAAQAADSGVAPPPVERFFAPMRLGRPVFSPDGRRLALLAPNPKGRMQLSVMTLEPPFAVKPLIHYDNGDVVNVRWVNNDRMIYTVADSQNALADRYVPTLFAIDADGSHELQLVASEFVRVRERSPVSNRLLDIDHRFLRTLRDGSDDILMLRPSFGAGGRDLLGTVPLRLNTRTRRAATTESGYPERSLHWLADERGVARLLATLHQGRRSVYRRTEGDSPWQLVQQGSAFQLSAVGDYAPFGIGPDGRAYVGALGGGAEGSMALYAVDPATGALPAEPLLSIAGFDFEGSLVFDFPKRRLLGVHYVSDAAGTAWLDPDMKALQARVDKLYPGRVNRLDLPECHCGRWMLLTSFSDRQPVVYHLLDRESLAQMTLGPVAPGIEARQMAEQDFVRIPARDGQSIPAYVTRPQGKGPWPAVVLVHGGPWVRGHRWGWEPEAQFLASRGYLVVAPEFRGSTGYGQRWFEAGWKQWGLKMQDDIADATRWAAAQKLADPQRICIAGGSYGGYATLMGLVRDPALYRCGVAWAAVTDIQLMFDLRWSDFNEEWKAYGMPLLVGDPVKDAAQFEATSPLHQAARITRPLLLAHGGIDRRVPVEHGARLRDALRKTNDRVEWIGYADEGHGWAKPENRYDFYTRMERFLATHLKAEP